MFPLYAFLSPFFFFFNDTATTEIYTLSLHDALPISMTSPRYDVSRFGAEAPRFSPRQSDLLWVVGTISQRQAPVLKRIYEQMLDPKWVLAFGTCASCGGFYDNYTTLAGIDKIIPCDVYVPGCPPRPEAVFDGLMLLQDKIARGDRTAGIVKPRNDPGG